MKKIILMIGLVLISFSCSNKEDDCRLDRLELIAKYDMLMSGATPEKISVLKMELDAKLRNLDC